MIPLLLIPLLLHNSALALQEDIDYWNDIGRLSINEKLQSDIGKVLLKEQKPPRNVIVFIGDGMGIATVTAARIARNQARSAVNTGQPFFFETFPFSGHVKTSSLDTHTTDSAASAVAIFSGRKVEQKTLGRKPGNGNSCENGDKAHIRDGVADLSIHKGVSVGFATTARITDATPAALYAKDVHRGMEYDSSRQINDTSCVDIAAQIISHPASHFSVLFGGGEALFMPESEGGNRTDNRNLKEEWKTLRSTEGKRMVITNTEQLSTTTHEKNSKVLGLFSPLDFPYYLDQLLSNEKSTPRLYELATKALQILQSQSDSKGYFLMIEGASIDKSEHGNLFHHATEEMNEFDLAIEKISALVSDDTLILVTADHAHALTIPGYLNKTSSIFDRDGNVSSIFFATGPGFGDGDRMNYTTEEAGDPMFAQPSAIYKGSGYHGAEDVGIWAKGPFAWLFSGGMENTQIAYNIKYLMCLDDNEENICDRRRELEEQRRREIFDRYDADRSIISTQTTFALLTTLCIALLLLSFILLFLLIRKYQQRSSIANKA